MVNDSEEKTGTKPAAAYLIVIRQVYPLDQELTNIGRGTENNLVIDNPSVSRAHVQINASSGVHEIRDLGSTGGTYINGRQVTERTLRSGDVISLAGVTMLFIEDSPMPLDTSRLRILHT